MSDKRTGDTQKPDPDQEQTSGLSVPREDIKQRAPGARSRRRAGVIERLRQAFDPGADAGSRWLAPVAILLGVLLLVNGILDFSRASRIDALTQQVAALARQHDTLRATDYGPDIDRLMARMDGLDTRVAVMEGLETELQALRERVAGQEQRIATLSNGRAAPASDADDDPEPEPAAEPPASPAPKASGDWVVNLITVGDEAAAKRFLERLAEQDIEGRIEPITRDGRTLRRVVAPGYASQAAAQAAAAELKQRLELPDTPWITKSKGG